MTPGRFLKLSVELAEIRRKILSSEQSDDPLEPRAPDFYFERIFDSDWTNAVQVLLDTCRQQQKGTLEEKNSQNGVFAYTFTRSPAEQPSDTLQRGTGSLAKYTGMVKSGFRPSDDAQQLPFHVPGNFMLAVNLDRLAEVADGGLMYRDRGLSESEHSERTRGRGAVLGEEAEDGRGGNKETIGSTISLNFSVGLVSLEKFIATNSSSVPVVGDSRTTGAEEEFLSLTDHAPTIPLSPATISDLRMLAAEIRSGILNFALVQPADGTDPFYAYEVDGYGNQNTHMDDANVPSLLSLPYIGATTVIDPLYLATRKRVLGAFTNPFFFESGAEKNGAADTVQFAGVGSPHTWLNRIWPMALAMRGLTADCFAEDGGPDDAEIAAMLRSLVNSHAGTFCMHESFDVNDPENFSRPWFAWANSLFGEFVVWVADHKPALLERMYYEDVVLQEGSEGNSTQEGSQPVVPVPGCRPAALGRVQGGFWIHGAKSAIPGGDWAVLVQ